jgi:hypothetical protein
MTVSSSGFGPGILRREMEDESMDQPNIIVVLVDQMRRELAIYAMRRSLP